MLFQVYLELRCHHKHQLHLDLVTLGLHYREPSNPTYNQICEDGTKGANKPKEQKFLSYRQNYNFDILYLLRFLHDYPYVTTDPNKADIFVVPYPHKSHCLCYTDFTKHSVGKCQVKFDDLQKNVLDKLIYKNLDTANNIPQPTKRHLYIHGADDSQQLTPFREATIEGITLTLGPIRHCVNMDGGYNREFCGQFAVPYVNTAPRYQPEKIANKWWFDDDDDDEHDHHTRRSYAVGVIIGLPKQLELRQQFYNNWESIIGSSIGGLENKVISLGSNRKVPPPSEIMELYQNSTFCPIVSTLKKIKTNEQCPPTQNPFLNVHLTYRVLFFYNSSLVMGVFKNVFLM